jgi:threonine synthase
MSHFAGYKCSLCGAEYAPGEVEYVCPRHAGLGNLDVVLDFDAILAETSPTQIGESRRASLWRYLPLLPVDDPGFAHTPLGAAGGTPLYRAERLGARLGLTQLLVKDDGRNPTASFKDRASAVVVARARESGAQVIVTASTGNAGAALAGMAAAVGHAAVIFAPETAPPAKVAQLLMFGAHVLLVRGNYDQAFDLSVAAAHEFGWYCRNTGYNPFTVEGKKTASYEICEQLGPALGRPAGAAWAAPDRLFVSVGDGNIIAGLHKGLKDLCALGWIDHMPKLMGVQAEGSAACANAWAANTETIAPVAANTLADSISVDLPRDGVRAVRAVRETGGAFITVGDDEILAAMAALGRDVAVFAEPAGAAAQAGLAKAAAQGLVQPNEVIVVMNTGNGLKDVKSAMRAVPPAGVVDPDLADVKKVIGKW